MHAANRDRAHTAAARSAAARGNNFVGVFGRPLLAGEIRGHEQPKPISPAVERQGYGARQVVRPDDDVGRDGYVRICTEALAQLVDGDAIRRGGDAALSFTIQWRKNPRQHARPVHRMLWYHRQPFVHRDGQSALRDDDGVLDAFYESGLREV